MAAMDNNITINYWPFRGRAGAVMLMLDHAGIPYEHKSEFADIAKVSSSFGGPFDTFAPPVVQDGSKVYSQSTAVAVWAGRKAGLTEGVDDIKAYQVRPHLLARSCASVLHVRYIPSCCPHF